MKIGVIASIAGHVLPHAAAGPWERVAAALTDGFVARGHDVTLFAPAKTQTAAWLHATVPAGPGDEKAADARVSEALHNCAAFERAGEFDVLANHFDFMPLTYSRLVPTPMVTTIHGLASPRSVPVYRAYDDIARYVSVSDADRRPDLHYAATIYPGVDTSRCTLRPDAGDYLLCLGRIHPDQGTHLAIEVARKAGVLLIIAGAVDDKVYFRDAVKPHVDGVRVTYAGAVTEAEHDALLGRARALLRLVSVAEPFSLSVVEALATGTPVIATPLGSMPELIRHGSTGFLVSDAAAAVAAVSRVGDLDRRACRQEAVTRFDIEPMVSAYLDLFERIIGAKTPRHPGSIQSVGSPGLFSHAHPAR